MRETGDDLARRASDIQYQLSADRARAKRQYAAWKEITDAAESVVTDFWCRRCRIDFTGPGHRQVVTSLAEPLAFYAGRCPKCRRGSVRRITDRGQDEYYLHSRKVWESRAAAEADMLQPNQWGFKTLYPGFFRAHIDEMVGREAAVEERNFDPSMRLSRSVKYRREMLAADYRNA